MVGNNILLGNSDYQEIFNNIADRLCLKGLIDEIEKIKLLNLINDIENTNTGE